MTESASQILSQYLDKVGRSNVYSIEMEQSEDIGEFYYLCHVGDAWYVVFESDYFPEFSYILKKAIDIFGDSVVPTHWLAKKLPDQAANIVPLAAADSETKSDLIFRPEGFWLRYAVLAVKVKWQDGPKFNPEAYGGAS